MLKTWSDSSGKEEHDNCSPLVGLLNKMMTSLLTTHWAIKHLLRAMGVQEQKQMKGCGIAKILLPAEGNKKSLGTSKINMVEKSGVTSEHQIL